MSLAGEQVSFESFANSRN